MNQQELAEARKDVLEYTNNVLKLGSHGEKTYLYDEEKFIANLPDSFKIRDYVPRSYLSIGKQYSNIVNWTFLQKKLDEGSLTKEEASGIIKGYIAYNQTVLFILSLNGNFSFNKSLLLHGICKTVEEDTLYNLEIINENIREIIFDNFDFKNEGYNWYNKLKNKAKNGTFLEQLLMNVGIKPRVEAKAINTDNVKTALEEIDKCLNYRQPKLYKDFEQQLLEIRENLDNGGAEANLITKVDNLIKNGKKIFLSDDSLGKRTLEKSEVKIYMSEWDELLEEIEQWAKTCDNLPTILYYNQDEEKLALKAALIVGTKYEPENFDEILNNIIKD